MGFFKARLREPSTWAGLGLSVYTIAQGIATKDPATFAAAIGGVIAALVPESKKAE
jgi:hypothetical protein